MAEVTFKSFERRFVTFSKDLIAFQDFLKKIKFIW